MPSCPRAVARVGTGESGTTVRSSVGGFPVDHADTGGPHVETAIIGGHGQVARHLTRLLVEGGDVVRAVVRDEAHVEDVEQDGATAVLHDVEADDVAHLAQGIEGCDAVVFAAGAGPGSGAERKWTVDHGGCVQALRAAHEAGVQRFVVISAMGTDDPPTDDEVFSVYLRAKAAADAEVRASGLQWTVVRPGALTDDPPTDAITAARHVERGEITRGDVAAVVATCLRNPRTTHHIIEVVGGDDPVVAAVDAAVD